MVSADGSNDMASMFLHKQIACHKKQKQRLLIYKLPRDLFLVCKMEHSRV